MLYVVDEDDTNAVRVGPTHVVPTPSTIAKYTHCCNSTLYTTGRSPVLAAAQSTVTMRAPIAPTEGVPTATGGCNATVPVVTALDVQPADVHATTAKE